MIVPRRGATSEVDYATRTRCLKFRPLVPRYSERYAEVNVRNLFTLVLRSYSFLTCVIVRYCVS